MDRCHDVFVSYAGEDKPFARQLVAWLEQAGLDVWFAEEDMRGSAEIQEEIAAVLPQCQHAILVISAAWLDKDWTRWEGDLALENDRQGSRVVPVLRTKTRVAKLGPRLHRLKRVEWFDEDPEPDARFWEVLCALGLFELGKHRDWAASGRDARGGSGSNILAVSADASEERGVRLASVRNAADILSCDRDLQWGKFSRLACDSPRHCAVLVPGPYGEGHKFFLQRVVDCLPRDPKRRVCEIRWQGPCVPQARGPAMAAIAAAFDCEPDGLVQRLHRELAEHNVVMVHQPPFEECDCDAMISYYTEWLPELVDAVDPPGSSLAGRLKFVQAIRWPPTSRWQQIKGTLLGDRASRRRLAKYHAYRTLAKELDRRSGVLQIEFLDELTPITETDLQDWSRSLDLDDAKRTRLIEEALDGENSAGILNRIAERLGPARRPV